MISDPTTSVPGMPPFYLPSAHNLLITHSPVRVDPPRTRSTHNREEEGLDSASVTAAMRELDRLNGVDRSLRKNPPNEDDNFF